MSDETHYDVAVSGGGLVGASFALALAGAGVRIALIEPRPPQAASGEAWDTRVYAVSPGSVRLLESCGAWALLPAERLTRVETMAVHGDDPRARLTFSAYDAALRELAFIVENGRLQHALWTRVLAADHIRVYTGSPLAVVESGTDAMRITLENGETVSARLLVGADGAGSAVRTLAGIAVEQKPYGQTGVVANFKAARPHEGTAFQWFRADGVLALLPLAQDCASMVWSTGEAHAADLLSLNPQQLAQRVTEASGHALGELVGLTPAAGFPLRLARVARLIAPRVALIGDAAHNVHPLAGQGVNLGFRDARELAAVIAARGPCADCGAAALLRRYERARREDILATQLATDGLQKLFSRDAVWVERLRNAGLRLVDRLDPVKQRLVRQAIA